MGTGSISIHHMRAWQAIAGVEIVALANRTRARAQELGRQFGIGEAHIYADYRELLASEPVDFVDIATSPEVHGEQVLAAAARRVHVLCQKPFAPSLAEAVALVRACEEAGVRCVVNENWRWRPWYREVKQLLTQGAIGQPRYARFLVHRDDTLPRPDGSLPTLVTQQPHTVRMPRLIIFEWGIHLIDVLRFLFGDVETVYAQLARISPLVQGEDLAVVTLGFRSGLIGLVDVSWGARIPECRRLVRGNVDPFIVEGEEGTLELDPYRGDLLVVTTAWGSEERQAHPGLTCAEAYQQSFLAAQQHFVDCLRSGRPAENEARDNLKTLAIAFAVYESAARKQPVTL